MPKINRPNKNISSFAQDDSGTNCTVFRSITKSDDLGTSLNENSQKECAAIGADGALSKQDSDAQDYTLKKLLAYIYQAGVPEWNAQQEYYINSVAMYSGKIYLSLIDDNLNFRPDMSWAQWRVYIPEASEAVTGTARLASLTEARNGANLPRIMTPALIREASSGGLIETRNNVETKIWTGTEEQYHAIAVKNPNTLYFCTTGTALATVFLGGEITQQPETLEPITVDITNSPFQMPAEYTECMWDIEFNTDGNEFIITISRNDTQEVEFTTNGPNGVESGSFPAAAGEIISSCVPNTNGCGTLTVKITLT